MLRPRSRKSAAELIEQFSEVAANAALVDRRLRAISPAALGLLAHFDLLGQPRWPLRFLLEFHSMLAPGEDGIQTTLTLFTSGFLFPTLPAAAPKLRNFEEWLIRATSGQAELFTLPAFARRAAGLADELPCLPEQTWSTQSEEGREADGLEIPLRLGCLWQKVRAQPLRITIQGDFFKRDLERLAEPNLVGPWQTEETDLPDPGAALAAVGLKLGALLANDVEVTAGNLSNALGDVPIAAFTARVLALQPNLMAWNAWDGWRGLKAEECPYPSVAAMALSLLLRVPEDRWIEPQAIARWIAERHCAWTGIDTVVGTAEPADDEEPDELDPAVREELPRNIRGLETLVKGLERYLCGWAWHLKLTQVLPGPMVRLTALARALLTHRTPAGTGEFPKTLLVQPNLQILAYRQGLTPSLISDLSRFAEWRVIGPACTLEITPESSYRGLETGSDCEAMIQLLNRHATKEIPPSVAQALRTWAAKRDRLSVYSNCVLLEFSAGDDLDSALARGIAGERLAERLLLVPRETDLDLRHFRLLGTRDYGLPPGQCVLVEADGVTLSVELAKADLLLDSELERFAEPVLSQHGTSDRTFRITPATLERARSTGISFAYLENWFPRRTGLSLPPAVAMLCLAPEQAALRPESMLILEVPTSELADGLWQWPATRRCIHRRLGPTAFALLPEFCDELKAELAALSWQVQIAPLTSVPEQFHPTSVNCP